MLTILSLFGRSPFSALKAHMECVAKCVRLLPELIEALEEKNAVLLEKICEKISAFEHEADLIKNDIRNHLPKSLFLPVRQEQLA